ncbi:MAG: hypothetical protein EXX96DRAFT_543550 [Benjaminiella poitrasii]|nr:MAG: hypothetical protein EXX96DRAFT_543550 [Benjaminiella poitrasii]
MYRMWAHAKTMTLVNDIFIRRGSHEFMDVQRGFIYIDNDMEKRASEEGIEITIEIGNAMRDCSTIVLVIADLDGIIKTNANEIHTYFNTIFSLKCLIYVFELTVISHKLQTLMASLSHRPCHLKTFYIIALVLLPSINENQTL